MADDDTKVPPAADSPDGSPGADAQGRDSAAPKVDPVWGAQSQLEPPVEAEVAAGQGDTAVPVRSAEERELYEAAERAFPDFHIRWIKELRILGVGTGVRLIRTEHHPLAGTKRGICGLFQRLNRAFKGQFPHDIALRVGAFPEPPLPTEPGPGEPPEVNCFLKPWHTLPLLACALVGGIWGPVLLAGFGRRLAAQDRVAWEKRYGVPMPLGKVTRPERYSEADCDPLAMLEAEWHDVYESEVGQLERSSVRYVKQVDGEWRNAVPYTGWSPYRNGVAGYPVAEFRDSDRDVYMEKEQPFSYLFPGRTASTYQPGSVYFELDRAQTAHDATLRRALDCEHWPAWAAYSELWESEIGVYYRVTVYRVVNFMGYRLHRAAFRGDWPTFEQDLDDLFRLMHGYSSRYNTAGSRMLLEVLAQHGFAMPDGTLAALQRHLLSLPNEPQDVGLEAAAWEEIARRRAIAAVLNGMPDSKYYDGKNSGAPILLQGYAMRYPWTRRRIADCMADLQADLVTVTTTPGWTRIRTATGFSWDPESLAALAKEVTFSIERNLCQALSYQRLMLAGIGALRIRRVSGAWPDTLGDCVGLDYQIDPYSAMASPLNMRVDGTGCLRLWSVDRNGVNSGGFYGIEPSSGASNNVQDIVLRLYWPPDESADATAEPVNPIQEGEQP